MYYIYLIICLILIPSYLFAGQATFSWLPNPPEDQVTHYSIHYGSQSRQYTEEVNVGNPEPNEEGRIVYTLRNLPTGEFLYFAATASNAEATSDFSDEASGTPKPDVPIPQDFRLVNEEEVQ
ncbi:MAG: hypothetical protein DRO67_01255 [Candidatus Asgardarchaeum californiense]|nr:MAG: hypothetical protein DRO67_01255 [Candidatus Asgardarchaeum californiense]